MRFEVTTTLALPIAAFAAFVAAFTSHVGRFGFAATAALTIVAALLNGLVILAEWRRPVDADGENEASPSSAPARLWATRASGAALVVICLASIASVVSAAR